MLDMPKFIGEVHKYLADAVEPLVKRIEELEARGALSPDELDNEVVSRLLGSDRLRTLADAQAAEAVADYFRENPVQHGKDGAGIADLLVDREGKLIATFTDGRMKDLGPVIGKDGENGKDGRDGADLTEVGLEFDGERTVTVKGRTGEVSKRLPIPLWRGYWSEGVVAERGDILTHNGTAYIAIVDNPKCEPGVGKYDHEWKVFTRKGRDGKDGRNGVDKTAPVKVKPDA